ncbi:hypothetical protein LTR56_027103 [Elasticomyces elasticus]|nr:hypothetical protein LTR56_027103 [Elasticomyces elasticus]KAK3647013.1 hypothetical protein LTR22_014042 [Elasticomyces elasticus]KAK4916912.1 hypothetical protein LTR49_015085 [Elasticomyces elasticus]KAK5754166.1 hypothetical protein LTS12_015692 [Elasticomyces elasticus]
MSYFGQPTNAYKAQSTPKALFPEFQIPQVPETLTWRHLQTFAARATGEIVEVVVGAEKRKFHVHDQILRSGSAFFEGALSKEWKEGQTRVVLLPDDGASLVDRYVQWLYTGKVGVTLDTGRTDYATLAGLYCLGEKLMHDSFQDRIIDAFVSGMREPLKYAGPHTTSSCPFRDVVDEIYKGTPKGSPGRRLMVNMHVMQGTSLWIDVEHPESVNHEFAVDLAFAMMQHRAVTAETKTKHAELNRGIPCSYHKHGKDGVCGGKARS